MFPHQTPPHPQTWIFDVTLLWHHLNICSHQSLRSTNERESFVDIVPYGRAQYSTQKFDAIVNFCTFVLQLLLQFNDILPAGDALMQVPLDTHRWNQLIQFVCELGFESYVSFGSNQQSQFPLKKPTTWSQYIDTQLP